MASIFVLAAVLAPARADCSWFEVLQADAALDLETASELALATIVADPHSADAVVAAGWWLGNVDALAEPEALLSAVPADRDPEIGYALARLAAELRSRAPAGTLVTAEISGPFGVFDTLDLERDMVPDDRSLPPLPSRWRRPAGPFRLRIRSADGWTAPPQALAVGGVYLAAWTIEADEEVSGWMVVEANGGLNIELDGSVVARLRRCGEADPGVSWFQIRLASGRHRLRVEMASRELPGVRVALLDDRGAPLSHVRVVSDSDGPWSSSTAAVSEPRAAARLRERLAGPGDDLESLLLAAAVARGRGHAAEERRWLERAVEKDPQSPWTHLELARFFVAEPTGLAVAEDLRRARQHVRACEGLPLSRLVERAVAMRERRQEDSDRLLDELVERHGDDPRVLQAWVREAVRRGWPREAEEGLDRLLMMLPGSRRVVELRIAVLEALERWEERNRVLRAMAAEEVADLRLVEQLAASCSGDEAVVVAERMRQRFDDPALDLAVTQLLMGEGADEQARSVLTAAQERWGDLVAFDSLRLMLAAGDPGGLDGELERALGLAPADLRLRALSWRRGAAPFFAPYRVDAPDLTGREEDPAGDVDAVLLLDQAVERIFADGSSIYYYHGLTRALTPAGARQAATLQQLPDALLLQVRIIKPDGSVVVPPELPTQNGSLVLRDVEPGDLVEEEYLSAMSGTGTSRRGHLSPYVYRFADSERAFGLSEYVLIAPPEVDLRVDGRFEGLERTEWDEDGLRVVRFRAERVSPVPREPFSPPIQELLPWVTYGFGVSWQDVGDAVRDRMLAVLPGSPELRRWSGPLLAREDPEEAVRELVSSVIDEVEAGRTIIDFRSTAGESFSRRQGNRLGIVAGALQAAGWQVDLVLARPLTLSGTHLEVPTMEAFPEPLLRATRGKRAVWIDLEEERRGVGHVRPVLQSSDALVLPLSEPRTAVSYLEKLPTFANPDLEDERIVTAHVDTAGGARISVRLPLRGVQAERLWDQLQSVPQDRVSQVYLQLAVGLFPGSEHVRGHSERTEHGVLVSLDFDLAGACDVADEAITCRSLVLARPLVPALASLHERSFPLILQVPILQRLEVRLKPPPGWSLERGPRRLKAPWGTVDEEIERRDGWFDSVLELQVPAQIVAPEAYPEFARFCHAVDELLSRPPMLTPGSD